MPFLGPKWSICPNENFFRKPVNEPCFFHSCLSTCQKSKSDINLLVKYWWLKNTEISLAESHFGYNLRTRFFTSIQFSQILMNHKNFHFTQIPDKTKGVILKTMLWGHFWSFFVIFTRWGFFSKKSGSVTHNYIWAPNTMLSFRKN